MTMTDGPRCAVRHDDLRCENVTTGALPICGSCLTELLEEADPRRRRALAVVEQLPAGVVQRLVDDPDPQVRAQVATRGDLDAGTIARLADPDREPAPEVWRALATTPAGAEHAWELCSTNDPLTLAIVASNPAVGAEVLERLVDNPDPDVADAAAAARAGRPPDARIAAEIADARVTEARPITQAPGEKPTPVEDAPPPELGDDATATAEPDRRRIVTSLIVGAIALVVIGAVIALAIGLSRGSSDQGLTASGGRVTTTTAATTSTDHVDHHLDDDHVDDRRSDHGAPDRPTVDQCSSPDTGADRAAGDQRPGDQPEVHDLLGQSTLLHQRERDGRVLAVTRPRRGDRRRGTDHRELDRAVRSDQEAEPVGSDQGIERDRVRGGHRDQR